MVSLRGEALRSPELVTAIGRSLRHRGPDGRGVFQLGHLAMGSERLRIVDLHQRADQPFGDSGSGRWLVGNGEIYNAAELRRRYHRYRFRSCSDIEVILPLYEDKGAEGLAELDGMFALAIWDEPSQTLTLARDRAGEKPLFYSRLGGELWFASEVQALLLDPLVSRDPDEEAIFQYLALGYIPEPRTAFREIRKIEAGTIVRFSAQADTVTRYWDPEAFATSDETEEALTSRLTGLLRSAVRKQMIADVPVGVFVSGGMDSALLASLAAQEADNGAIRTFVARFSEDSYDESEWAAYCSRLLGAKHREVRVDENSLAEALSAMTEKLAEPLADPAILPTWLLAREARNHVKVILSGEGADELFGGYPTYLGHRIVPYFVALPGFLRRLVHWGAERLPASRRKVTNEYLLKRFLADAEKPWIERHAAWFGAGAQGVLASKSNPHPTPVFPAQASEGSTGAMLLDYRTYLRDNLLVKIDRATMLNSLEARAPYLDRDLTAFALALPRHYKLRGLSTKWLLKKVARQWLPKQIVHRRKRGLSVPVASWLDGGLRSEVDRLLAPERLQRQGLIDPQGIRRLLAEHRSGTANHARPLWTLLVFQYWLERWVPDRSG